MSAVVRIIGIDPGLRNAGWGIVEVDGTRLSHVADGRIQSDGEAALAERLLQIHSQLLAVLREFVPHEAAIEETFVNKDARATLKLGQARGAAMLAPALLGIPIAEYAPNVIKKSVVGAGHAEKTQIRHMVRVLLPKASPGSSDSADALAIAICHAHHRGIRTVRS